MVMAAESQFHILAVDDCRLDRMLIEKLLKKTSYQVTTVDSGSKALEFLGLLEDEQRNSSPPSVSSDFHQELEVNLIITDYCMPGMSGYDLLKKIKESSSLKDIPVVIMSSENVPSRITRCLEEGAEEFFLKPVKLSDVKKLKPHSRRGKSRDQQEHQPEQEQELKVGVHKPQEEEEEKSKPKEQPEEEKSELEEQSEEEKKSKLEEQPEEEEEELIVELEPNEINNKRKGMEEGISQERSRPRWQDTLV